jgi:DNA-binding LacI/PurR family transcriptional regulator
MLEPKLTTIEQSTEAIGKAALKSMMKLINGEELDYFHQTIDVKLIERDTTKKVF